MTTILRQASIDPSDDGTVITVTGDGLDDRASALFFRGVLGGTRETHGWACPTRGRDPAPLILRINTWLERQGYTVKREGPADIAVERDIERVRSYQRALEAGRRARDGFPVTTRSTLLDALTAAGWDNEARPLREHQIVGALHALSAVNAANFSVPGAGKTVTTLAVAALQLHMGNVDLVLVVGPLSSFRPWETETWAALPRTLRVRRVRGSASRRRDIYEGVRAGDLLVMSYATAAHDRRRLSELLRRHGPMLVVDESHRIKRFRGGTWAPALAELARLCRVRIVLSGTPMPQGGRDLFSQLRVLWPGQELTGPRDSFAAAVKRDLPAVITTVMPFVSRTPKSALGLSDYLIRRHNVVIDDEHDEIYQGLLDNFRNRVAAAGPVQADRLAALRRARPVRLLQAVTDPGLLARPDPPLRLAALAEQSPSVAELIDRYATQRVPAKTLAALDILRDIQSQGGKCVVWSNFLASLDRTASFVHAELGIPVFQVDGRVPTGDEPADDTRTDSAAITDEQRAETREEVIERFLSADGTAVLFANPASCSESISLHRTCRNAIYLDRTYDCALWLQSIDRIHRLGLPQDAVVSVHILTAKRADESITVDSLVDASLLAKEQSMRLLLEGAELLPLSAPDDPTLLADGDNEDLGTLLRYLLGEDASS